MALLIKIKATLLKQIAKVASINQFYYNINFSALQKAQDEILIMVQDQLF